jgi:hypothetical protein
VGFFVKARYPETMKTSIGFLLILILFALNAYAGPTSEPEKSLVAHYSTVFSLDKDILTIHFENKKQISFVTNVKDAGENTRDYTLLDYNDVAGVATLKTVGYEWERYDLISTKDGKQIKIPGVPVWSPNWHQFVAFGDVIDEDADTISDDSVYHSGSCENGMCTVTPLKGGKVIQANWKSEKFVELTFQKTEVAPCTIEKGKLDCSSKKQALKKAK